MKNIHPILLLLAIVVSSVSMNAQEKYIDKNGIINFEASEETFEPVKAKNESVTAILNTAKNEIAALALMKSFRFKNSLMEEHFNENYIESETYPKATFRGKLLNFDSTTLTENEIETAVEGVLKLHGKEKQINTTLLVKKVGDEIHLKGSFTVTPQDFDIEIPSVVRDKIAKEIIITFDFKLSPK